jgi:riboflavin transporter FmnP
MRRLSTKEIALASVLGALAAVWEILPGPPFDIPFPLYTRISWDLTGIPIMVSTLFYGITAGTYTCLIGCSVIFFRGNIAGGILKLMAELATLIGFSLIKRNIWIKSASAIILRVVVMTIGNYYLLPLFYPTMPVHVVLGLLIPVGVFNLSQALINIIPAYIIYWRIRSMNPPNQK